MTLLTDELLAWIGTTEPTVTVEVTRRDIQKYSAATEQLLDKYLVGDEAPPMFIFNLFAEIPALAAIGVDGLPRRKGAGPRLPLKRTMAGGTRVDVHRPILAGDVLTATRTLTGMYEKQGRTGPLIFVEYSTTVLDAEGGPVVEEHQTAIAR